MPTDQKCEGCGTTAGHHGADCPIEGIWFKGRVGKTKRAGKPKCKNCGDRHAKWPKSDPRFCTQRCAAEWAYNMCEGDVWVEIAGEVGWYDHGDWRLRGVVL